MSKIMIIDSGLGAMTFAKAIIDHKLLGKWIVCLDQKNNPYGIKNQKELLELGKKFLDYARSQHINQVFIGCNTLAVNAFYELKALYPDIEINSVIDMTLKAIKDAGNFNKVLVLATNATVNSRIYDHYLENCDAIAVQKLVTMIENMESEFLIREYLLNKVSNFDYDIIVLGCTHFPIVKSLIEKTFNCRCVDGIEMMINHYRQLVSGDFKMEVLTSGDKTICQKQIKKFFNLDLGGIKTWQW